MSEEKKNPYFEEIKEKIQIVANKIFKTLGEDDTIQWEDVDITWEHHDSGSVCLNVKKLVTWQFKDTLRKAYDWEAEQKAKEVEEFKNKKCVKAEDVLKIHNKLNAAEKIYPRWDDIIDYYCFKKDIVKRLKKWRKQCEWVYYIKPTYGSAPWDYPTRLLISSSLNKKDQIEICLNDVDVERTLKEYYHE